MPPETVKQRFLNNSPAAEKESHDKSRKIIESKVLPSAHKIVKLLAPPKESFDFYEGTEETRRNNIPLKTRISFQMNRFSEKGRTGRHLWRDAR